MSRIIIAEDDIKQADLVRSYLERDGHSVIVTHDGRAALDEVRRRAPDAVLLDVMMPKVDGLDVCRVLRLEHPQIAVIMLTARASEDDQLLGFDLGADDYITKPYSMRQLVARVRAVLRRTASTPDVDLIHVGALMVDRERCEVRVDGRVVDPRGARFAAGQGVHPSAAARGSRRLRPLRAGTHRRHARDEPAPQDRSRPGRTAVRPHGQGPWIQAGGGGRVMLRSVRARVIALAIGVAVVTAIATGWLATTAAENAVRTSAERSLEVDTSILQSLSSFAASTGTWDGVEQLVGDLAESTGRRIALTDTDGLLLVDSDQVLGNTPRSLPAAPVASVDPLSASLGLPTLAVSVGTATIPAPTAEQVTAVTGCLDAAGVAYVVDDFGGVAEVLPIDVLSDDMFRQYAACTVVLNSPAIEITSPDVAGAVTDGFPTAPTALLYLDTRDQGTLLFQGPTATRTIWLLTAVVAAAALIAWLLGRRLTRPLAQLTGAAQRMESGDLTQRVVVGSRDEVGALGHAFNSMADSLQRTESLRQRMVTDIAHELRNPLVTLGGTLEAIQDGIYPTSPEVIASLAEETAHLQRLVGDLHDLSVADSVGVRLDRQPTDLLSLVSTVVEAHRSLATSANVVLKESPHESPHESSHDAAGWPAVSLDAGRIRQALSNLLGNAIRHAASAVTITVALTDDAPSVLRITVADDGPGIPAEHLGDVFERFWRADSARARSTGGTGLGLAISRELVRAHGGELTAQSTVGHGATFTITLPIA